MSSITLTNGPRPITPASLDLAIEDLESLDAPDTWEWVAGFAAGVAVGVGIGLLVT